MPIKRNLFNQFFELKNMPEWICPYCNYGHLRLKSDKSMTILETEKSKLIRSDYSDEELMYNDIPFEGNYMAIITCSNKDCSGKVYSLGGISDGFDANSKGETEYMRFIEPKIFNPPIKIFDVPSDVPENIGIRLNEAFNLFWIDSASCANKIRVVLELIMDNENIKRQQITRQHKRRFLFLKERIEIFSVKYPHLKSILHAVRWIGNEGSHANKEVNKNDLLDGFEFLENILTKIYGKDEKRLNELSNKIVKKKGSLSKKVIKRI